ncbi:MAG: hypothetical protein A2189_04615, partial [Paenibacillus sp. RIFOXYA1_FULL_44_5]
GSDDIDRLVLLPRDNRTLYLYWNITKERKQMAEDHFHINWMDLPKAIRMYDVTKIDFNGDDANYYWDMDPGQSAVHAFVYGITPNCFYCADYGVIEQPEKFVTLLRSSAVKTPPGDSMNSTTSPKFVSYEQYVQSEPEWLSKFTGYSLTNR